MKNARQKVMVTTRNNENENYLSLKNQTTQVIKCNEAKSDV